MDGRVLVCDGKFAAIYVPATNAWTKSAKIPSNVMWPSQSTLADGRVLMCGGDLISGGNTDGGATNKAHFYNPRMDSWVIAPPMRLARDSHSQSTLVDGRVLVCGGRVEDDDEDGTARTEIFDPHTNTWIEAAPMLEALWNHSQSTLSDGRVLVCGGCGSGGSTEIYNPITNTWIEGPQMQTTIFEDTHSQSTLADGRVLVCGGDEAEMLWVMVKHESALITATKLPPVPSTESMRQEEKVAALHEWLSVAEATCDVKKQQAERARGYVELRRKFNVFVSQMELDDAAAAAHAKYQEQFDAATDAHKAKVAAAKAASARLLKRCTSAKLDEDVKEISRVRRLSQEAELFSAFLEDRLSGEHAPCVFLLGCASDLRLCAFVFLLGCASDLRLCAYTRLR
jgi:hypothetical protein